MATKKKQNTALITKADIAEIRSLIESFKKVSTVRKRIAAKFKCDLCELDEWAGRLASHATLTDEEVCFAMGRLAYEDCY